MSGAERDETAVSTC